MADDGTRFSGPAVASIAAGGLLVFAGLKGYSLGTAVTDIIRGVNPLTEAQSSPIAGTASAASPASGTEAEQLAGDQSGAGSQTANKALGRLMAGAYGWAAGDNWACLESGWQEESGWSATAQNGTWPGAYGIPQANPGTKLPKSGWPAAEGGDSSATAQIAWGLAYIKDEYGAPVNVPGWTPAGPAAGYEGY